MSALRAAALLGLTLSLAACSTAQLPTNSENQRASYGAAVDDSASVVTVKRDQNGVFTVEGGGNVNITFQARPGSDAGYVTGYRITSDSIDGVEQGVSEFRNKFNIYVPSGFTCDNRSATDSCGTGSANLAPANGLPSSAFSVNFSLALASLVKAKAGDVGRVTALEFIGVTSNGAPFSVKVDHINSIGIYGS